MSTKKKTTKKATAKKSTSNTPAKVETKNEVATTTQYGFNIESLLTKAVENSLPMESLRELLEMRKKLKDEWAQEEYNRAMAAFQAECPVIEKNKQAKDENKNKNLYKYAPLDSIVDQVKHLIAKHGFSYSFDQENDGSRVKVTCKVSHEAGHIENSVMETGLTTKTNIMSGPQQIAATVTFNKRYAFCNAFGIMTGDEDTDARNVDPAPQPRAQAQKAAPKKKEVSEEDELRWTIKQQADELNPELKTGDDYKSFIMAVTDKELKPENYEKINLKLHMLLQEKEEMEAKTAEVIDGEVVEDNGETK